MRNPLNPPTEDELSNFARSVEQQSTYTGRILDTMTGVRKSVGGTLAGAVNLPLALTEKGLNALGFTMGLIGGTSYMIGNLSNRTQTKIHQTLSGQDFAPSTTL